MTLLQHSKVTWIHVIHHQRSSRIFIFLSSSSAQRPRASLLVSFLVPFFIFLFPSVHQTASPPQASSDHANWETRKDLFIWLLTRAKESQEWLPLMWNWTLSLVKQGFSLSLSLDMQSKRRSSQSNVYPPDLSFPILSRSPFCLFRLPVPFLVPLPVVCFPFRCFQWSFDIRRHHLPFPDMEPPWTSYVVFHPSVFSLVLLCVILRWSVIQSFPAFFGWCLWFCRFIVWNIKIFNSPPRRQL